MTWTHLTKVFHVEDPVAIHWYLTEASREMWSVRTLDRNISTQYYERLKEEQWIVVCVR
ncbi:MAG: hypothetical protein IJM59_01175 [Proteobacteria bacterium]|nr:hypothetical protein [Pseudomonadota bacterium]